MVSISTAVSLVTCKQPAILWPAKGSSFSAFSRNTARAGILLRAQSTFRPPAFARDRSATVYVSPVSIAYGGHQQAFKVRFEHPPFEGLLNCRRLVLVGHNMLRNTARHIASQ